ncbi:hypothetical protein AYM40_10605 [Paraburkholderia phytofirmans OLGA172]|uniref:TniQ family protein n=1 Tax=Paraburkholderia phytofirmans OLGA172 TaxID=1417228 RepID=A0A160FK78_9BURK|nr:hypothetical protein AYM40_10605 [Paraburkholderia phytofirmans OLGA172]
MVIRNVGRSMDETSEPYPPFGRVVAADWPTLTRQRRILELLNTEPSAEQVEAITGLDLDQQRRLLNAVTLLDGIDPSVMRAGCEADFSTADAFSEISLKGPKKTRGVSQERWTGSSWSQMPHESVFGVYGRFCHVNALEHAPAEWPGRLNERYHHGAFGNASFLNVVNFERETGLTLRDVQTAAARCFPNLVSLLFSDRPRLCQRCLRNGYHSTWHQFQLLDRCPLHDEELTTRCLSCSAERRWKRGGRYFEQLGKSLFTCRQCGKPPSGEAFLLDRYLRFRHQSGMVDAAFASLDRWLRSAQAALWPIEQLLVQNRVHNWTSWTTPSEFLWGAIHSLHPLPEPFSSDVTISVRATRWCQTVRPSRELDLDQFGERGQSQSTAVYASVLRRLTVPCTMIAASHLQTLTSEICFRQAAFIPQDVRPKRQHLPYSGPVSK